MGLSPSKSILIIIPMKLIIWFKLKFVWNNWKCLTIPHYLFCQIHYVNTKNTPNQPKTASSRPHWMLTKSIYVNGNRPFRPISLAGTSKFSTKLCGVIVIIFEHNKKVIWLSLQWQKKFFLQKRIFFFFFLQYKYFCELLQIRSEKPIANHF